MSTICVRIEDVSINEEDVLEEKVTKALGAIEGIEKVEKAEFVGPMPFRAVFEITKAKIGEHNFIKCEELANWRLVRDRGPEAIQSCVAERLYDIMQILTFVIANCDEMKSTEEDSFLAKFQDACEDGIDEATALAEVLGV